MREYDEDEPLAFLTEQQPPWSGVLEDVLRQNDIPYFAAPTLGAGMALKVGPMQERIRYWVPFSFLPQAKALVEDLFSGEEDREKAEK